tara:strand:- start:676 stop:798 length:123 start_codon:yes stop_codon:yes gene_type:complete
MHGPGTTTMRAEGIIDLGDAGDGVDGVRVPRGDFDASRCF